MEDLVIFSSVPMCLVLGAIVLLHVLGTVIPEIFGKGESFKDKSPAVRFAVWVIAALNAVLHFVLIGYAFIKDAKPEEMLLVVMISAAVGMSAIGIREKISSGKK